MTLRSGVHVAAKPNPSRAVRLDTPPPAGTADLSGRLARRARAGRVEAPLMAPGGLPTDRGPRYRSKSAQVRFRTPGLGDVGTKEVVGRGQPTGADATPSKHPQPY